jgi:uncharacterized protein YndB with AHSA1/START domain
VHIASDRTYRFAAEPAELWERIADVSAFPTWWPWLRRFEAQALEAGEVWHCTVQPPLPYTLSFAVAIGEVEPPARATATISGEIHGTAELTIEAAEGGGCTVRLRSRLAPQSRFLQGIALVARPGVALGHDWVLDTGARQFRRQLP